MAQDIPLTDDERILHALAQLIRGIQSPYAESDASDPEFDSGPPSDAAPNDDGHDLNEWDDLVRSRVPRA